MSAAVDRTEVLLKARIAALEEALFGLLDGLDINWREARAGLLQRAEWRLQVERARRVLQAKEKP